LYLLSHFSFLQSNHVQDGLSVWFYKEQWRLQYLPVLRSLRGIYYVQNYFIIFYINFQARLSKSGYFFLLFSSMNFKVVVFILADMWIIKKVSKLGQRNKDLTHLQGHSQCVVNIMYTPRRFYSLSKATVIKMFNAN